MYARESASIDFYHMDSLTAEGEPSCDGYDGHGLCHLHHIAREGIGHVRECQVPFEVGKRCQYAALCLAEGASREATLAVVRAKGFDVLLFEHFEKFGVAHGNSLSPVVRASLQDQFYSDERESQ